MDSNDHKHNEETLRETEQKYRDVFEGAQDILLLLDRQGSILDINHQAEVLTGYSQSELRQMNVFQHLIVPEDKQTIHQMLHDLTEGQRREYEVRWRAKDGRIIHFAAVSAPRFSPNGDFLSTICALRDITEHKKTEEALRDSEAKFRGIFETVHSIILMVDRHGNILDINPYAEKVLGYSPSELRQRNVFDGLYVPEDRPKMRQVIQDLTEGHHREYEVRWIAKDGRIVTFAGSSASRFGPDGEFISTLCTYIDITRRKEAEESLQKYTKRLETLHEIDEGILNAHSLEEIARAVLNLVEVLVPCQRAGIFLFDYELRESIVYAAHYKGESWFASKNPIPFADLWKINEKLDELRQGQVLIVEDMRTLPRYPGIQRTINEGIRAEVIAPLVAHGELIGTFDIGTNHPSGFSPQDVDVIGDVTVPLAVAIVQMRLFEEVSAGREQIKGMATHIISAQEEERRRIAYELHDEIGQSLTALKMNLDLIEQSVDDQAKTRLDDATKQVDELLSRIRNLSLDLRPAMLDHLGLLPTLQSFFERYTNQTNIQVVFEHKGFAKRFTPEIESAVYRIVQEALTNVARHASVNKVTVRLWEDKDRLYTQIEDQGIGFDPEAALLATDKSGLSGMRERAMLLDGQLFVESSPGGGTWLTAELPLHH